MQNLHGSLPTGEDEPFRWLSAAPKPSWEHRRYLRILVVAADPYLDHRSGPAIPKRSGIHREVCSRVSKSGVPPSDSQVLWGQLPSAAHITTKPQNSRPPLENGVTRAEQLK